jgi:transposase-like protein
VRKHYPVALKAEMVKRMLAPGGATVSALSAETGIPKQTLSAWLGKAHKLSLMADEKSTPAPQQWAIEDKARIVAEAAKLHGDELGAFLRREGVHPEQLAAWRRALEDGYNQDRATKRYIGQLEREIRRKDKALAEAAALAILKKKVAALMGGEDDDTDGPNES